MNPKTLDRILLITALALGFILVAGIRLAYADEGHGHDHHDGGDVTVPVDVFVSGATALVSGGDVSTGGNKALAISNSLGDVDFTGICQGSSQWGTPVISKQKIERDEVCLGFAFLKIGRYALAQMHFCMDKKTLGQYTSVEECEDEHDFTPVIPDHDVHSRSDEFAEAYAQQEHEIEFLQEENASIVGRLDDLTALLEQAPSPVPIYVPQEPEPKYTDADVAYILGLYSDEEPDDE